LLLVDGHVDTAESMQLEQLEDVLARFLANDRR
jgi:hypothetical protein